MLNCYLNNCKKKKTTTYSEINGRNSVQNDEHVGIRQLGETIVESSREQEDEQLKVKIKRTPRRGLMFRHRSDDRNVVLGIGRIQERVEAASPRRDFTFFYIYQ